MHDTGTAELDVITVNQKSGGGEWHELGTFSFWGGVPEWVEINAANGRTSADAIRFEEIPDPVIVNTQATYFVHTDHLGTPRRVSDDLQTLVWSWDSTPFGESPPNQDPDGNFQEFVLNLRYPGQYFEGETGLYYNYFRTYDPGTGRYMESDPIGLRGGLNTYAYVGGNPLIFSDSFGLLPDCENFILKSFTRTHNFTRRNILLSRFGFYSRSPLFEIEQDLDPRDPRKFPLKPDLTFDWWWARKDWIRFQDVELKTIWNTIKVFCEETLLDDCGNEETFYSNFQYDKIINKSERNLGPARIKSEMTWLWKLFRW
jgi:RHS repeat-associated protein